ncbi:hypothetical protein GQS52_08485 [Streptomyces sp. SCUT-3]|uniref:hypothetical protein n=1 Tax=Streptomyces sp. SCUT-3 TaxID=2684469 RepID=UPI0015FADBCA|nr:hypothetical protein [Streptomyces sp. SCUT-3]QMV21815.1 hypothetical protein GQS52_08485 [Streptomyces sp. SCUT-3]
MLPSRLDPERAARLSALVAEYRPQAVDAAAVVRIQEDLYGRGLNTMDAILVTRELIGAGPGGLGRAQEIVLAHPSRAAEWQAQQELIEGLERS